MTDDELRQACRATRQRMNRCVHLDDTIDVLMTFARRMQAVGVRRARARIWDDYQASGAGYSLALEEFCDWCEAEEKRLEGGMTHEGINQGPWQVFDLVENRCRALHSVKREAEDKAKYLNNQIARDANGLKRYIVMELND